MAAADLTAELERGRVDRLLIGAADGGRVLTLVIEQTVEPRALLVLTAGAQPLANARAERIAGSEPSRAIALEQCDHRTGRTPMIAGDKGVAADSRPHHPLTGV